MPAKTDTITVEQRDQLLELMHRLGVRLANALESNFAESSRMAVHAARGQVTWDTHVKCAQSGYVAASRVIRLELEDIERRLKSLRKVVPNP